MSDDDWVKLAMNDDVTVADLLFRLRKAGYERRRPPPPRQASPPLKLYWSVRQRRSKPLKKKTDSTRASPTTPLSWSGATSVSGGCAIDGFEESSKPAKATGGARSKVSVKSEPTTTTTSKRPRKKKTLAELKEEETLLLRERKKLRTEIATMRLNIEKQKATNENLNRLKLDLISPQKVEPVTSYRAEQVDTEAVSKRCSFSPPTDVDEGNQLVAHQEVEEEELESEKETGFSLPDLNLPADTDFTSSGVVLYGIS